MNNQLKQLEKLGKDVENFEKRLDKAFHGIRNKEVVSNTEKRIISSADVPAKSKGSTTTLVKSRHGKPSNQKDGKTNCAIVEVKVKTKRHGKARKTKSGKNVICTKSLDTNKPPTEPIQSERSRGHCCCSQSSKNKNNIAWGNILRQSVDKKSTCTSSSRGLAIAKQDPRNEAAGGVARRDFGEAYRRSTSPVCAQHNFRRSISSEGTGSEHTDHDECCNEQHSDVKLSSLNNKNHKNRKLEDDEGKKSPRQRSLEETNSKGSVPLKPLDTLHCLMEELRDRVTATADQSTQKLVQDLQIALDRMSKTTPCASEVSFRTKYSSKMPADGKEFINTLAKNNLEIQNSTRIPPESPQSPPLKTKITAQPKCIGSDMDSLYSGATSRINENHQAWKHRQASGPYELANSVLEPADKLNLPAKLNIDSNTRNQNALGYDEKMKAELEYLNKQLKLQLKSVEGITTKESEYRKLVANLIEKVDKLEAQVTEQSKVAQHFYAQSNALLEQNSVIPVMQKSHDQLREQLQDTIRNYEKLKVEYCLVKLEKEKYYALNCTKEKQISKFKSEIMDIQSLVVQQMENLRKYEGYSSASEKVDNILSMIDTQSTLIKSRIKGVRDLDGKPIPIPGSPTSSNSSAHSRPLSPFSPSVKLNSPNKHNLSPHETGWSKGNIMDNM